MRGRKEVMCEEVAGQCATSRDCTYYIHSAVINGPVLNRAARFLLFLQTRLTPTTYATYQNSAHPGRRTPRYRLHSSRPVSQIRRLSACLPRRREISRRYFKFRCHFRASEQTPSHDTRANTDSERHPTDNRTHFIQIAFSHPAKAEKAPEHHAVMSTPIGETNEALSDHVSATGLASTSSKMTRNASADREQELPPKMPRTGKTFLNDSTKSTMTSLANKVQRSTTMLTSRTTNSPLETRPPAAPPHSMSKRLHSLWLASSLTASAELPSRRHRSRKSLRAGPSFIHSPTARKASSYFRPARKNTMIPSVH